MASPRSRRHHAPRARRLTSMRSTSNSMRMTEKQSRHCRKTGAASIQASRPIGIDQENGPLRGHSPVKSIVMIALLDHHHPVAVTMAPSAMPAMVAVHLGTRAVAIMMATALDDDGLGAGNRRRRNHDRAKGCDDKSKLLHDVISSVERGLNSASWGTFRRNRKRFLNRRSASTGARSVHA